MTQTSTRWSYRVRSDRDIGMPEVRLPEMIVLRNAPAGTVSSYGEARRGRETELCDP